MIHPDTELRLVSERVGYGVFSTRLIPRGTITWTIDELDRRFEPAAVASFGRVFREIIDKYAHRDREGRHVLCWDHARFVNHGTDPDCLLTAFEFELAIRDILPGEELTDEYGCLNVARPFRCDPAGTGRDVVYPDDLLRFHTAWDARLREAFTRFRQVDQPLRPFLTERVRNEAEAVARGDAPMPSVSTCYFGGYTSARKPEEA